MASSYLEVLFNKYYTGVCTPEEEEELMELARQQVNQEELKGLVERVWESPETGLSLSGDSADTIFSAILQAGKRDGEAGRLRGMRRWTWVDAASFLAVVGIGTLWVIHSRNAVPKDGVVSTTDRQDVAPAGNRAMLVLGDGTTIALDSAHNGELARQGNTKVSRQNGEVVYKGGGKEEGMVYNTLTTPRGGFYNLVLQDGTKVWLNAASSLRYPVSFAGKERVVEVTGEAYFEVAHDPGKPFRVKAGEQVIEDIGTGFNVNAYPDEGAITTTLVEGAIRVKQEGNGVVLKPGEQASIAGGRKKLRVSEADVEAVMAWKNGMFRFNGAGIEEIMRQVARWYDVEVVYEGPMAVRHYHGAASRNINASEMLKVLEQSDIRFRIEGKKIILMRTK